MSGMEFERQGLEGEGVGSGVEIVEFEVVRLPTLTDFRAVRCPAVGAQATETGDNRFVGTDFGEDLGVLRGDFFERIGAEDSIVGLGDDETVLTQERLAVFKELLGEEHRADLAFFVLVSVG